MTPLAIAFTPNYFVPVATSIWAATLPAYLKLCRLATPADKGMMVLRWFKNQLGHINFFYYLGKKV